MADHPIAQHANAFDLALHDIAVLQALHDDDFSPFRLAGSLIVPR